MRIPFACTFKELLASYDKANDASYLLIFFPARYKAVMVCGSSANLPAKLFPVK
jgi:hypothetical protein